MHASGNFWRNNIRLEWIGLALEYVCGAEMANDVNSAQALLFCDVALGVHEDRRLALAKVPVQARPRLDR